jgi:hypothetical protein
MLWRLLQKTMAAHHNQAEKAPDDALTSPKGSKKKPHCCNHFKPWSSLLLPSIFCLVSSHCLLQLLFSLDFSQLSLPLLYKSLVFIGVSLNSGQLIAMINIHWTLQPSIQFCPSFVHSINKTVLTNISTSPVPSLVMKMVSQSPLQLFDFASCFPSAISPRGPLSQTKCSSTDWQCRGQHRQVFGGFLFGGKFNLIDRFITPFYHFHLVLMLMICLFSYFPSFIIVSLLLCQSQPDKRNI